MVLNGNINMIRINTLEIAGFAGALKALRLPFGREMRSNIETYNIQIGRASCRERV